MVAAAVRFVAKAVMTGGDLSPIGLTSRGAETIRGNISSEAGIGYDVVLKLLEGIPGIGKKVVEQQLANLKASGHYARIIKASAEAAPMLAEHGNGPGRGHKRDSDATSLKQDRSASYLARRLRRDRPRRMKPPAFTPASP